MLPQIRPSSDASAYGYTLPTGPLGARVPVCGDPGRPAGGALWPGLLWRGRGQEHLWHRLFCPAQHRRRRGALPERAADHRGLQPGAGPGDLCPGRLDRHHRRGGAVAARQPGPDPERRRDRSDRPLGRGRGRLLLCARLFRPLCALLGHVRAGRHRRPDALCQQGAHCAGHAGGDLLPDARRDGGHAGRRGSTGKASSCPRSRWTAGRRSTIS